MRLAGVTRNNLNQLDVAFPLGVFTTVTGVSGSGKSSLVSQALVELVAGHLGHAVPADEEEVEELERARTRSPSAARSSPAWKPSSAWCEWIKSPSDARRAPTWPPTRDSSIMFASYSPPPKRRDPVITAQADFPSTFPQGRCETCEGEGFVFVELLFLPSVYAPCPTCHGARYNAKTFEIKYRDKTIADVLGMTVDAAWEFFADEPQVLRALNVLREVGLGYLRLGQPATELSGGEAQRIKLATELQRIQRGNTLYILDEPTTGLHPSDVEKLVAQLDGLVESGNTVIVVEHDMRVVAASDYVIDIGPGAGEEGGRVVASGTPAQVSAMRESRTAPYLARFLNANHSVAV